MSALQKIGFVGVLAIIASCAPGVPAEEPVTQPDDRSDRAPVIVLNGTPGVDFMIEMDRLRFPSNSRSIDQIRDAKVGDLIVWAQMDEREQPAMEEPAFLRKIFAAPSLEEGDLIVATESAPVTDVLVNQEIADTLSLAPSRGINIGTLQYSFADKVIYSDSILQAKVDAGEINFTPELDFALGVKQRKLDMLRLVATGRINANVQVTVSATASITQQIQTRLWSARRVFVQVIGYVPVVEVVDLSVDADMQLEAQSGIAVSASATLGAEGSAGAEYAEHTWSPVGDFQMNSLDGSAKLGTTANASAAVSLIGKISVRFYDAAGPALTLIPNVGLTRAADSSLTASAGVKSEFLAELTLPLTDQSLASYKRELFNLSKDLPILPAIQH